MNELELYQLFQTLLNARKWAGDSGNDYVFPRKAGDATKSSSVLITSKPVEALAAGGDARFPMALIVPQFVEYDREEPRFARVILSIILAVTPNGPDPIGEMSLVGGHKVDGLGSSLGRGILELSQEVQDTLRLLTRDDGATIVAFSEDEYDIELPVDVEDNLPPAIRQLKMTAEI